MGIEFYVVPHFQQGRPRPRNQTVQRGQRGRVSIREEHDPERHRTVRVARFEPCGAAPAAVVLPPLFDAEVLACTGEWMSVAGFERVAAGPLQDPTWFAQSWWLVPAPLEDLLTAESRINRLSGRVAELEVELERLRQERGPIIRAP